MNGYCRAPGQSGCVPCPLCGSIQANSTPLPGDGDSGCVGSFWKIDIHTRNAPVAPHSPVCLLSSRPTHTTARCWPVKPANQESRWLSDVPVLPAACSHASEESPTTAAVPYCVTCCI